GPALEAGAAALDTARALVERMRLRQIGGECRLDKRLRINGDLAFAVRTDESNETLGHYTVRRRDELIGFNAHVEKSAEHVDDVVGVDRREHEVAGERRLNGDLRRLGIAD